MKDRLLMEDHKTQIYGTQATCIPQTDGSFTCVLWPIKITKKSIKEGRKLCLQQLLKN
jgi:hypothetical protein